MFPKEFCKIFFSNFKYVFFPFNATNMSMLNSICSMVSFDIYSMCKNIEDCEVTFTGAQPGPLLCSEPNISLYLQSCMMRRHCTDISLQPDSACLVQLQNYSLLEMRHDRGSMLRLLSAVFPSKPSHNEVFPPHVMSVTQGPLPGMSLCRCGDGLSNVVAMERDTESNHFK